MLSLLKSLGRRSLTEREELLPGTSRYLVRGKAVLSLAMEVQERLETGWSWSITVRPGWLWSVQRWSQKEKLRRG